MWPVAFIACWVGRSVVAGWPAVRPSPALRRRNGVLPGGGGGIGFEYRALIAVVEDRRWHKRAHTRRVSRFMLTICSFIDLV
jgi:hypothetical protein